MGIQKTTPNNINTYMDDKCKMRDEIIEFFKDRKLNKNSYFRRWYERQNKGYIYDYINEFYKDNIGLYDLPLNQKVYHIIHNITELPNAKFLNFKHGYAKGLITFSGKCINTFISRIENMDIQPIAKLDINVVIGRTKEYIKKSSYTKFSKDRELLDSISYYTPNIDNFKYKIALLVNEAIYCKCNSFCNFTNTSTFTLNNTCGSKKCISNLLSNQAKKRDLSYLQSEHIKQKRVKLRKNYHHTTETKNKISTSNKNTWCKLKRSEQVFKNRENGVYKKQSELMKEKILEGSYTPNTLNRLNHKRLRSDITGIKNYRSSWELKFHELNPSLKYEVTRIKYNYENKDHIYITDFTDDVNKIIYEIKPENLIDTPRNLAKAKAAAAWCAEFGYVYKIITQGDIL
jgi:hypothetical protein